MDPGPVLHAAMSSPEGLRDPYQFLDPLVAEHEHFIDDDGHSYVLAHAAATAALRSPALYKGGEHSSSTSILLTPEQHEAVEAQRPPSPGMLTSIDDPDHARLRRLVNLFFTPKSVEKLRLESLAVLDRVLDELDVHEPVNLLSTLFTEVPSEVVGSLMGLPLEDRPRVTALAAVSSLGRDPDSGYEERIRAVHALSELYDIMRALMERERANSGDSLVGGLLQLEAQGEHISDDEVVSLVSLMHTAGFGTTRRLLGNGLVAMLHHPEQAQLLRDCPQLTRRATDEVLRYDTSISTVAYRVGEGADLGGEKLAPGTLCTVILAAANHDPRVFDEPSTFDVAKDRRIPPLAFGHGAHYCLGAALAKMECDVVIGGLLRRFPHMELAADPERVSSFRSRTFRELRVVLEPRRSSA